MILTDNAAAARIIILKHAMHHNHLFLFILIHASISIEYNQFISAINNNLHNISYRNYLIPLEVCNLAA